MTHPGAQLEDGDLARQARAGSLEAFDQLMLRYQDKVFAYTRARLFDRRDAEDATQKTFVKAYRHLGRFDPARSFSAWILGIARHEVLSLARARRDVPSDNLEPVDERRPSESLTKQDDHLLLWNVARETLSEPQFSALWMVYHEDCSVAEAARALRRTVNHVKVLLHRGRQRLKQTLDAGDFGRVKAGRRSRPWAAAGQEVPS